MDEWLDDDANLSKWEDNTLTASDRRILLANWYFKAVKKALESEAKRKYFEHAGALLTADGTDDHLIKLEGTPAAYKLAIPADAHAAGAGGQEEQDAEEGMGMDADDAEN